MANPVPPNFPAPKPREPGTLSLPRRRREISQSSFDALDASAAARESISALIDATRSPFGNEPTPATTKLAELERTLRQLELKLAERERIIAESNARLAERERDIAEAEALLLAREELLTASRSHASQASVSPEEKAALEHVKAELLRQEANLRESKDAVREREIFLDESETKLFAKVQEQQEKENELEQREEDLRARDRRLREREAAFDPQVAAALQAEAEAAKKRDEFNE
jgi:septal ring factor EnvC (AmiA/AmiB activator)